MNRRRFFGLLAAAPVAIAAAPAVMSAGTGTLFNPLLFPTMPLPKIGETILVEKSMRFNTAAYNAPFNPRVIDWSQVTLEILS